MKRAASELEVENTRLRRERASTKPNLGIVKKRRRISQAWVGDITHIATAAGWLYLACIMDVARRRSVGGSMSDRIKADRVGRALKSAYWQRKPLPGLILHTDRGSQYAGNQHRTLIRDFRRVQSMSRTGNGWDNAPIARCFKTLKVERVHPLRYEPRAQAAPSAGVDSAQDGSASATWTLLRPAFFAR